jgi:hypothetical protein
MSQESPQIDPLVNIEDISEYKTSDSPRIEIAESTQDLAQQILSATYSGQSANLSSPVTSSPLKESDEDVFCSVWCFNVYFFFKIFTPYYFSQV